jgi:hypothetical protein
MHLATKWSTLGPLFPRRHQLNRPIRVGAAARCAVMPSDEIGGRGLGGASASEQACPGNSPYWWNRAIGTVRPSYVAGRLSSLKRYTPDQGGRQNP